MALKSSLLIIGCGDVGLRVVRALGGRLRVFALTSSPRRCDALRRAGVRPLVGVGLIMAGLALVVTSERRL